MKEFKIWCETKEQEKAVLKQMEAEGIKWYSGDKPTELDYNAPLGLFVRGKNLSLKGSREFFKANSRPEISVDEYVSPRHEVVIYRKGCEVYALDKQSKKRTVAKCNPADEFDFQVGAKLALGRLFGEQKPEAKPEGIKPGDHVRVARLGESYSTYEGWAGLKGYEQNFVSGKLVNLKKTYIVRAVAKHDRMNFTLALIQDEDTTQVFIIGVEGLEVVK